MGKANRKHRAAKRVSQSDADLWVAQGVPVDREPSAGEIGNAIMAAAMQSAQGGVGGKTARGDSGIAKRFGVLFAGAGALTGEVGYGTQLAGQRIIGRAFEYGWLPADIAQAAQRRTDAFVSGFLIDVIAGYVRPFAAGTVHETWHAQFGELGADVWWSESATHISQWAAKHMLTAEEAMTAVVEALALLLLLPKMELIRPLPGTARPQSDVPHHVDEKVLGRVRGLLAKAESTSFPEEAEALSAKAQELMTKYAVDRVLVDADTSAVDLPGARRIWLDTPYTDAKALLIDAVANANRSRAIFMSDWGFVTIVGDDADLDAVEVLSTSLLVQATRAMIGIDNNETRTDARTFRKAFLVAYATRIGERLAAATAATIAQSAAPERLLPVLASHQLAVDNAFETLFPQSRSRGITIRSAEGWDAGRAAADRARLDARRTLDK
ncbi:DUF2786 domain-containing protein [Nocardia sp. SYP-A9097]|uniref:DUF2786 domain-containing protein n=1 Tax=Nocardia sp. SYP-A9097 TaxID=2663237 RepID=UPI00281595CB|nr:DUF2786 domain-containing protein [Nocardia sp. SYP-A9097]